MLQEAVNALSRHDNSYLFQISKDFAFCFEKIFNCILQQYNRPRQCCEAADAKSVTLAKNKK